MVVRVFVVCVCGFITAQTVRIGAADWLATENSKDGLDKAIRVAPVDSALLTRAALLRSEIGDMSPEVDRLLLRTSEANPLNANLLIALGIRTELRGDNAATERYLVRAADADHTFKPTWTLINFYSRTGRREKTWTFIRRILALDPLAFNPDPVFDLCWDQTKDPEQILALMPDRETILVRYLFYLLTSRRIDAAAQAWPRVLASAKKDTRSLNAEILSRFPEYLMAANRIPDAVRAWNQLVDYNLVLSSHLDVSAGRSISDPNFNFPAQAGAFGWRVASETGLYVTKVPSAMEFEFDGDEPQSSSILLTTAPLLRNKPYRLVWKSDGSGLNSARDPGFSFRIVQQFGPQPTGKGPVEAVTECPPLLGAGDEGTCPFMSLPDATSASIELWYKRAPGTVRIRGTLRVVGVRLEFAA